MTTILLLLGGILVVGLALALELLRLTRAAPQSLDPAELQQELSDLAVYRPMSRLFASQDFSLVASQGGDAALRRLRCARWTVMSLYLRQMRQDFHRVWSLCRLLAPLSDSSELSVMLIRQFVIFHFLYLVLRLRCVMGWYGYVDFDIANLVSVLNHLRLSAQKALRSSEALALQSACSFTA